MQVTNQPSLIDDQLCRQATQFQQFDLLPIAFRHRMVRVGQADKRHLVFTPPIRKNFGLLRTDRNYLGAPFYKFQIVLAQLRHMPAAVWSNKAAVENKNDMPGAFIIREPDLPSLEVCQFKIGRRLYSPSLMSLIHTPQVIGADSRIEH